jgi:predicted dehydrogenase
MLFNWEYPRRMRAGFIGAGLHAFRNIYPCFQFLPIDLVAIADHHEEKAKAFARMFGAERWYLTHDEMLEKEKLDAVFICVSLDQLGRPRYPALTMQAMQAGCHVWIEKPPAATTDEIRQMQKVSRETGKFVVVGFKKCFMPAIEKAKEIISRPEFGGVTSVYSRYPLSMPEWGKRESMRSFGDIVHPGSALHYLMGPLAAVSYMWNPANGGMAANLTFRSGAIGSLHITGAQGGGPLERIEIVGNGANVVVDNCMRVIYYRKAPKREYGRTPDYYEADEGAALTWEPEFSLGQLYNKALFLMGYVQQVEYFAQCVLENRAPTKCGLDDALEITKWLEAFLNNPPDVHVRVPEG